MADVNELAGEQAYFDDALEHRENARHRLGEAPAAAASPKDAIGIRKVVEAQLGGFRAPEEAVAFGRIDNDDDFDPKDPVKRYYIGYHAIDDDEREPLVINWQTRVGERFYEASHTDPKGVVRRRRFIFKGESNTIEDFEDDVFADLHERVTALEAPHDVDDVLLAGLGRIRTGEMQDIVQTIRAAQHRIIRDDLDQLLLVQGGPGTGKTAVALHRVSWLLFNHRDEVSATDVVVIGPTSTFVRYIRQVLPSLGDQDVRQLDLAKLGPNVAATDRVEPAEVVALKGEARMAGLLDRALRDRVSVPTGPLELSAGSRRLTFTAEQMQEALHRLRDTPYNTGRQRLRDGIRQFVQSQSTATSQLEVQPDALDNFVERIWPQLTAPAFLQELLGSEARLLRAAGDDFTAREVRLLHRRSSDRISTESWSRADVPLLDHARYLMAGQAPERFRHIVVDEAQDLSPMQLTAIQRRSVDGSMTILGDLAQSTGPWARDSWDEVVAALRHDGVPAKVVELDVGYRVPRQAFELAARLLPLAAPSVTPPQVIRDGPEPTLRPATTAEERAELAVAEAMAYASLSLTVGVICPASLRDDVVGALAAHGVHWRDGAVVGLGAGINLLDPEDVKGLEFDAVVVVEPDTIAGEYARGLRLLYVALTRTTRHLSIVHVGPMLPGVGDAVEVEVEVETAELEAQPTAEAESADTGPEATLGEVLGPTIVSRASRPNEQRPPRVVELMATSLAEEIQSSLPKNLWRELVEALRIELERRHME